MKHPFRLFIPIIFILTQWSLKVNIIVIHRSVKYTFVFFFSSWAILNPRRVESASLFAGKITALSELSGLTYMKKG